MRSSRKTIRASTSKSASRKSSNPEAIVTASWAKSASTNREQADGSKKEEKEYLWGYGSGVASSFIGGYGEVVLAEYTLPFNEGDITYFVPLYIRTVAAL